jgi:hypothetical protein
MPIFEGLSLLEINKKKIDFFKPKNLIAAFYWGSKDS